VNIGGSGVSGREAIVTLVASALMGFEAVSSLFFLVLVGLLGMGWAPYLLPGALGLIGGCGLGLVLLRQGGISIPSRQERAATRGALVGLVVGVVVVLLTSGPIVGIVGICVLVGLAVGRTFDRSSIHPTA
jgi:Na+/proline symporter